MMIKLRKKIMTKTKLNSVIADCIRNSADSYTVVTSQLNEYIGPDWIFDIRDTVKDAVRNELC